jgi:dipeptidyl aminopeptidase/acylaminoacyl peptidase
MIDHLELNPWIAEMIGGFPEDIPEEYDIRSAILAVDKVNCPLLLIHGEIDDVIPVRHTLRLARKLAEYGKSYEARVFEGEEHIWSPQGFTNNWHITLGFFNRYLKTTN